MSSANLLVEPIAAVILAAGSSSRLGRPKQTLLLRGEALLARAIRIATEASLSPILVIVAPDATLPVEVLQAPASFVANHAAREGMASSIRCGIHTLASAAVQGVVLLTCDQVLLTPDHLRALVVQPERITGSAYAGRIGIPAYFPRDRFPDLLTLTGDTGARQLLHHAASVVDENLALDIDTPDDAHRAGLEG